MRNLGMDELRTGWSPRRVADALGITEQAMRWRIARGLVPATREPCRGRGNVTGRWVIASDVAEALISGDYEFPEAA